jgi:hypothetical protein
MDVMQNKKFGILMAGAITAMTANLASANEHDAAKAAKGKKAAPAKTAPAEEAGKMEMVKCYSESCAGKLEFKGQKNTCGGKSHAMEVPKDSCDTKKGLVIEHS